jgi:hypothetical protein
MPVAQLELKNVSSPRKSGGIRIRAAQAAGACLYEVFFGLADTVARIRFFVEKVGDMLDHLLPT